MNNVLKKVVVAAVVVVGLGCLVNQPDRSAQDANKGVGLVGEAGNGIGDFFHEFFKDFDWSDLGGGNTVRLVVRR